GVDLVNLALAVMSDPERALGPGKPGVTAAGGRRDGMEHGAGLGIDLVDLALGDLEQMPAVEGGSRLGSDVDGARDLGARGVDGVDPVARSEPDLAPIIGDAADALDAFKGSVLPDDFGHCAFHVSQSSCG